MRSEVLDFYGLSDEQAADASVVLGGAGQRVHRMRGFPSTFDAAIDWDALAMVAVVNWGSDRIGEILEFLRRYRRNREFRLAGVIGRRIWSFHVLSQERGRAGELANPAQFFPPGRTLQLPWSQEAADQLLNLEESSSKRLMMPYCRVADVVLQLEIGQELLGARGA